MSGCRQRFEPQHTADIAAAHLSNNTIPAGDVPMLIESVYAALAGLSQPAPVVEEKREPAVSIRASVKPDAITCLECGAKMTISPPSTA